MNHNHISEEMIIDYVLNNLSSEEHFAVTSHLKRCNKCTLEQNTWRKYLLHETCSVPSPSMKQKLIEAIRQWKGHKTPQLVFVVMTLFVVSVIGMLLAQSANQQQIVLNDNPDQVERLNSPSTAMQHIELFQHTMTNQLSTSPVHQLVNVQRVKSFPTYMKAWENRDFLDDSSFIILNNGAICTYDSYTIELICYQYDPIFERFYRVWPSW